MNGITQEIRDTPLLGTHLGYPAQGLVLELVPVDSSGRGRAGLGSSPRYRTSPRPLTVLSPQALQLLSVLDVSSLRPA